MISFFKKTPGFWYKPNFTVLEYGLIPVSWIYGVGQKIHTAFTNPVTVRKPVICIGNLNAGGSGKTPTAIAIASLIIKENIAENLCFLTRGYGGNIKTPTLINRTKHSPAQTGDEAWVLSQKAPTIVSQNRARGAARAKNYDLIIMDDGMQNYQIAKTVTFAVIDGAMGFGNERLLPAGPLREPLSSGLKKVDGFVFVGTDQHTILENLPRDKPVFKAHICPDLTGVDTKKSYIAFCGLGYPQKFFNTLELCGLKVVKEVTFPDHHLYSEADLTKLEKLAANKSATLITTEKDFVKIPPGREKIKMLPITLEFKDAGALKKFLKNKIKNAAS